MTIYAVGDIHGQKSFLDDALARIDADDGRDSEVIFLGDFTDRGPDSRGVIETLVRGQQAGRRWTCLKGNHDRMFRNFLTTSDIRDSNIKSGLPWTDERLGGITTLQSYGVSTGPGHSVRAMQREAQALVPATHQDFLANLSLYAERGRYLFVHAGIRPGLALADQVEDDLIWIRDPFLTSLDPHPWIVVHGHTALKTATHFGNRIDLDSGAGYGRPLSVAAFDGDGVFLLTERGREPLRP
ncbi:metallophosphoesterase family protein [Pseudooceanicola sp.]|uniref:metallophosphoesterase family protein n=1 Tax=Pseudooceanicola sp. TaxID=1914328 RepID=UPI004058B91F